jgi:hypothetical protein
MKEVAKLLNDLRDAGVIHDYALFGATAQMRYTEPVATLDADVLVTVPSPERLDVLQPIYKFCASKGFVPEGEAIRVGGWPVQFVPVFSSLTEEALAHADSADFDLPMRTDWTKLGKTSGGNSSMTEIQQLLERQAAWQKERRNLSWEEKIRMIEDLRESIRVMRESQPSAQTSPATARVAESARE